MANNINSAYQYKNSNTQPTYSFMYKITFSGLLKGINWNCYIYCSNEPISKQSAHNCATEKSIWRQRSHKNQHQ